MIMKYEESFTAFLDFLGFSEASKALDEPKRERVLQLLLSLVALRSEFSAAITEQEKGSTRYLIRPAISTFSDHIVISYGLESLRESTEVSEDALPFFIFGQINTLISTIAAQALRLGFLIRGAATIGKLYHANGVVFGEALVETTQLEARTAVYPRVVLSSRITNRPIWRQTFTKREDDGILCIDYIKLMPFQAAPPGDDWATNVKQWFDEIFVVVKEALETFEREGKLNELGKWTWFAKRFRTTIAEFPPQALEAWKLSINDIPWEI